MSLIALKDELTKTPPTREKKRAFDGWLAAELLFGCVLFVLAKALAAEHDVYLIDRFDIWIVGLVPMVVLGALAWNVHRKVAAARFYIVTWLVSLIAFLVLQDLHLLETIEDFLVGLLEATNRNPVDGLLCLGFSLAGVSIGFLLVGYRIQRLYASGLSAKIGLVLINWAMLFVFVFWSRFAA